MIQITTKFVSHGFNGQTVVFDPDNDCTEKAVTLINVDLETSQ